MPEHPYAHFIGAGGAGMSGIALVLAARGIEVTGSDLKESRYSRALERAGVKITIGHAAENLGNPDVVVISSAISESNPELAEARRRGLEVWPRARMLAHLAGERKTIAVAGTHGKTTTSSMVATMLSRLALDPSFLIGGEVDGFDTNALNGSGEYYVVEADESSPISRPTISTTTARSRRWRRRSGTSCRGSPMPAHSSSVGISRGSSSSRGPRDVASSRTVSRRAAMSVHGQSGVRESAWCSR